MSVWWLAIGSGWVVTPWWVITGTWERGGVPITVVASHTPQAGIHLNSDQFWLQFKELSMLVLVCYDALFLRYYWCFKKKNEFYTMWYEPFHPKHHKEGNCPEITLFMSAGSPTLINNSPLLGLFLWEPLLTNAAVASHNVTLVPLKSIFTHHIIFQILGWPQEPLKHDQLHHSLIVEKYENHSVNWVQFRPLFKLSLSLVNWD